MTWQQIIEALKASLVLLGQIDPAVSATAAEIEALTDIAGKVAGTISTQAGIPIEDVLAQLTPEDPTI